jgi:dihydropteroate synthase
MIAWVGILNVTPDSFSDGKKYDQLDLLMEQADRLVAEGAMVLDVGGESTRPGATPIDHKTEWQRLRVPLTALCARYQDSDIAISIDSFHYETVAKAIEAGVSWVNDVSGLQDPKMLELLAQHTQKIVLMHSVTPVADPHQSMDEDIDVVEEILAWAKVKISMLERAGIDRARVVFDPGIGFGKTREQNIKIIQNIRSFLPLGLPLYVGHSRKSLWQGIAGDNWRMRDVATASVSAYLASQSVSYCRVHDVAINQCAVAASQLVGAVS